MEDGEGLAKLGRLVRGQVPAPHKDAITPMASGKGQSPGKKNRLDVQFYISPIICQTGALSAAAMTVHTA